jgi:glycosyltransferase involved in cell wall biosynthesis
MTAWLLIAGDFVPLGGMDRANHALARYLADQGKQVSIVAHRVSPDLEQSRNVAVHRVPRPLGSHFFGSPLLAREGQRRARGFTGRVIANGGNARRTNDVSWVHYVHGAYEPTYGRFAPRIRGQVARGYYLACEVSALHRARVVVCNSRRTADDVRERVGVPMERIRVVYYGSDPASFAPVTAAARAAARAELGWPIDRPVVSFIGALGDRRKGFDRLFDAWRQLCGDAGWDADLAVVGHGGELPEWERRARDERLSSRIRFLGFRDDVPRLLAASDVVVHPARYEAYGLGVHEAICRGLPAIVSATAGIAELYPAELSDLLIRNVEDSVEIADRIQRWRSNVNGVASCVRSFSDRLHSRTWRDMAAEFERTVDA